MVSWQSSPSWRQCLIKAALSPCGRCVPRIEALAIDLLVEIPTVEQLVLGSFFFVKGAGWLCHLALFFGKPPKSNRDMIERRWTLDGVLLHRSGSGWAVKQTPTRLEVDRCTVRYFGQTKYFVERLWAQQRNGYYNCAPQKLSA